MIETAAFREGEATDIAAFALVTERANAQRDGIHVPLAASDATLESVQVRMDRVKAHAFAAVVGERVVGYALSHPLIEGQDLNPLEDPDTEHLAMLMVDPDYWGKKIASNLLALTVERAQSHGKRRVTLWTRKDNNERTRSFYEHNGFVLSGAEKANDAGRRVHYEFVM